jgi:P pilus assembly chaperone PapD
MSIERNNCALANIAFSVLAGTIFITWTGVPTSATEILAPRLGSIQELGRKITPERLTIADQSRSSLFIIRNSGKHPIALRARIYLPERTAGILLRTDAAAVSPPQVVVPPGSSQVVRVVRLSKAKLVIRENYVLSMEMVELRADSTQLTAANSGRIEFVPVTFERARFQ